MLCSTSTLSARHGSDCATHIYSPERLFLEVHGKLGLRPSRAPSGLLGIRVYIPPFQGLFLFLFFCIVIVTNTITVSHPADLLDR